MHKKTDSTSSAETTLVPIMPAMYNYLIDSNDVEGQPALSILFMSMLYINVQVMALGITYDN